MLFLWLTNMVNLLNILVNKLHSRHYMLFLWLTYMVNLLNIMVNNEKKLVKARVWNIFSTVTSNISNTM